MSNKRTLLCFFTEAKYINIFIPATVALSQQYWYNPLVLPMEIFWICREFGRKTSAFSSWRFCDQSPEAVKFVLPWTATINWPHFQHTVGKQSSARLQERMNTDLRWRYHFEQINIKHDSSSSFYCLLIQGFFLSSTCSKCKQTNLNGFGDVND